MNGRPCRAERTGRRGVALLIVLAAVVLIACSASIAARARTTAALTLDHDRALAVADALLPAAEAAALQRLAELDSIVLPPESREPRLALLEDAIESEAGVIRLGVTAFDLRGMVPLDAVREAAFAGLLDPRIIAAAEEAAPSRGLPPGPDLIEMGAGVGLRVFPSPSVIGADGRASVASSVSFLEGSDVVLNVCTAPMELIEAALRRSGAQLRGQIVAARAEGRAPAVPAALPLGRGTIRLTTRSDAWALRVDVGVGRARRSWWSVVRLVDNEWRVVQRVVIAEHN